MVEVSFLRYKPFKWIYFNWGIYRIDGYTEKRIVLDFYVQIKGKVRGFSLGWNMYEKFYYHFIATEKVKKTFESYQI